MTATDIPVRKRQRDTGLYVLHRNVERTGSARVGKLGEFRFAAGHYLYVGSAMNSFWPRVRRHLERQGPRHWHVDHLRDLASPEGAWVAVTGKKRECELAATIAGLAGVEVWPPRFGASDCRCPGHLLRLPEEPDRMTLAKAAHSVGLNLRSALSDPQPGLSSHRLFLLAADPSWGTGKRRQLRSRIW